MAASNHRNKCFDTVHHLMSRIAHRVYILDDADRSDFLEIVWRAAEFTGIRLLGWCVMTNHFHLLVHLPPPLEVDENEILRRYGVLKGKIAAANKSDELAKFRAEGRSADADAWLESQRRRMGNLGSFMKIAKQWFTEDYNRRHAHTGTLWEGEYVDKLVGKTPADRTSCLGYIHLNPIRAGICVRHDDYVWSSLSAVKRGDRLACEGLRFVYGDWESRLGELVKNHVELLDALLEDVKRQRAEELARRRRAGFSAHGDDLTTEALVQQAAAHLEEVSRYGASVWENRSNLFSQAEKQVLSLIYLDPMRDGKSIVEKTGMSKSSVYRVIESLCSRGVIVKLRPGDPWILNRAGIPFDAFPAA